MKWSKTILKTCTEFTYVCNKKTFWKLLNFRETLLHCIRFIEIKQIKKILELRIAAILVHSYTIPFHDDRQQY